MGTKILPEAWGLRAIPSRADPAARPWPMAPPSADRPMARAAARPSHLSRSARAASADCARAGLPASKTTAATKKAYSLVTWRMGTLLLGFWLAVNVLHVP